MYVLSKFFYQRRRLKDMKIKLGTEQQNALRLRTIFLTSFTLS